MRVKVILTVVFVVTTALVIFCHKNYKKAVACEKRRALKQKVKAIKLFDEVE